jgi:hypothetical protein
MPIHPLNGVEVPVVRFERDYQHGRRYVVVERPGGGNLCLPVEWTDRGPPWVPLKWTVGWSDWLPAGCFGSHRPFRLHRIGRLPSRVPVHQIPLRVPKGEREMPRRQAHRHRVL